MRYRHDAAPSSGTDRELAQLVDRCTAVLGAPLTAYLAAADSVDDLEQRLAGPEPAEGAGALRGRLLVAAEVIDIFTAVNRVTLAGAWLREVEAVAGDPRPPASILRDAVDATARKRVTQAAGSCTDRDGLASRYR